jgi:hypothetical protein
MSTASLAEVFSPMLWYWKLTQAAILLLKAIRANKIGFDVGAFYTQSLIVIFRFGVSVRGEGHFMSQNDSQGPQEEEVTIINDVNNSSEDVSQKLPQEAQPDSELEADEPFEAIEAPPEIPIPAVQHPIPKAMPTSPDAVVETLRRLREEVGQINELSSEEGSIVAAFSLAFLKFMEPLTKALPVDTRILPPELGALVKANILPKGDLIVLHRDGRMESLDLSDAENRDLLVMVLSDTMPRFNQLISQRRSKIENRINFLSSVTKELQTIVDSFVEAG